MSQENVEIVRRIIDATRRGDWGAALRDYDQGVILDQSRMPGGGVYRGHEGLREFYGRWFGAWEHFRIKMRSANVWTITRGKVVRQVAFPVASDALEAAGLSE